jgi:hypothetical protein
VRDLVGRTRIVDACGQAIGDPPALLALAQRHDAAIRRQQAAVELGHNGFAGNG